MIFRKNKAQAKKINENLEIFEYCDIHEHSDLDMDGAIKKHFKICTQKMIFTLSNKNIRINEEALFTKQ